METENTTLEQIAVDQAEPIVEVIQVIEVIDLDRPLMTTNFDDYTVTEGLLLLLLLYLFTKEVLLRILRGGFSWLFW